MRHNMTDTKLSSHLRASSSHLENMTEVDERGVASAPDIKLVPEEDMDNPQVGVLPEILPTIYLRATWVLITITELVSSGQTFHVSNYLLLHISGKCQFQQLYRRDAGYNQRVRCQPDSSGAAGLLQCILVWRW